MAVGTPLFRNRTVEKDHLAQLLRGARAGESAALVVRGPAGIGKTALLNQCAEDASDFRIARISGVESELELPFAGLHQLCAPMMTEAGSLPAPQRDALRVAFGLIAGDPPDHFLLALALLSLVSEVGQKRPLLCLIDDAQWLDAASAQVFGVVARRLLGASVVMIFSVREPNSERQLAGLPELFLVGLAEPDARALLQATVPGRIDDSLRDRIVAETQGNPLALLELPRGMTAAELAGGFPVPYRRDLPKRVEETFLRRLGSLPEPTQRLMLVAAADPTGDVMLLRKAAQALQIQDGAAALEGTNGLIELGAQVHFRHPLARSAIYWGARASDRRAVHLALAQALDPGTDPDRRAWHRALAARAPDEAVASELERSAGRAQSRGGLSAAAAFLTRAAELTPGPERRGQSLSGSPNADPGRVVRRGTSAPNHLRDQYAQRTSARSDRPPSRADIPGRRSGFCCARTAPQGGQATRAIRSSLGSGHLPRRLGRRHVRGPAGAHRRASPCVHRGVVGPHARWSGPPSGPPP